MESSTCNVIYVDRAISQDRHVETRAENGHGGSLQLESEVIVRNVSLLLEAFQKVYLCSTGGACLLELVRLLEDTVLEPIVIILETPYLQPTERWTASRAPSSDSRLRIDYGENQEEELYGFALLKKINSESADRGLSKLVLPITLVSFPLTNGTTFGTTMPDMNRAMLKLSLEMGAVDMLPNPIVQGCINTLVSQAYHAHQNALREQEAIKQASKGRRRSWIGLGDEETAPVTHAMVSELLKLVCDQTEKKDTIPRPIVPLTEQKRARISSAVSDWYFNAHDFTEDDDLILVALVIFEHALSMPELKEWRIPTGQLYTFLLACRAAYNIDVPYHNFCHVVDVLQATFHFLVKSGGLPPLSATEDALPPRSPIAQHIKPFQALTLLITAIGHDVGHPGLNNGFLTTVQAPLAQVYSDRSVLENFHCASYCQILRQHWPQVFNDCKMKKLMTASILSTDMSLHGLYMNKLTQLKESLAGTNPVTTGCDPKRQQELEELICALLIKCADISNVARSHDTAIKWMHTLAYETTEQRKVESKMNIPSSIFAQPGLDVLTLTENQLGFMNGFATPLFEGVADLIPSLQYCVDEIFTNKRLFDTTLAAEKEKLKNCASSATETAVSDASLQQLSGTADTRSSPSESDRKAVNGIVTSFDAGEDPSQNRANQRRSENTEGSSNRCVGDWASQATSATTSKMPLSPSTQGTSIVSRESLDPANGTPAPESVTTGAESAKSQAELKIDHLQVDHLRINPDDSYQNGNGNLSTGSVELGSDSNKKLKKKPSRFAGLRDIFRSKHKTASPPLPPGDIPMST
ncbi:3',5'-cyclic-nucleotide phosphodiesterase regA [Podospora australis]|uniref:Phosphodiesterase n=1 Tax=Podospora australis TaxID=1536484 RepID=A0AAN7AM29_9PEZI|nr:3',5'-cyclic-nucleotide phosphodiesterase regA [Podospora australis]